jgi:hypothetical protein
MGDRNNIKITYSTGDSLYLYTHWRGSEVEDIVTRALATSSRVDDESYFARVLFCALLGDNLQDWRGETGFGIAPYAPDQDYGNDMVHIDYTNAINGKPAVELLPA